MPRRDRPRGQPGSTRSVLNLDVVDLRNFYGEPLGRTVREILRRRVRAMWPRVQGDRIMGLGYATPLLRPFTGEADRLIGLMPARMGVVNWPAAGPSAFDGTEFKGQRVAARCQIRDGISGAAAGEVRPAGRGGPIGAMDSAQDNSVWRGKGNGRNQDFCSLPAPHAEKERHEPRQVDRRRRPL